MKINDYWTDNGQLIAISDGPAIHFIDLKQMEAYLERNDFLDWHWFVKDDVNTAMQKGRLTFDEWLQETEHAKLDIATYLQSQKMIKDFLDPINNILKFFKRP